MPDQLDVESALAVNAIRRRVNTFQRLMGNPVTPYPIRLPDGRDVERYVIKVPTVDPDRFRRDIDALADPYWKDPYSR